MHSPYQETANNHLQFPDYQSKIFSIYNERGDLPKGFFMMKDASTLTVMYILLLSSCPNNSPLSEIQFKLYELHHYDSTNALTTYSLFEYDAENNYSMSKSSTFDDSGVLTSYALYEWNNEGNLRKAAYYNSADIMNDYYLYEYNSDDNMTISSELNASNVITFYIIYSWREAGST